MRKTIFFLPAFTARTNSVCRFLRNCFAQEKFFFLNFPAVWLFPDIHTKGKNYYEKLLWRNGANGSIATPVATKTMLKLCSPNANWNEMIFHRDFCGGTTRFTRRYDVLALVLDDVRLLCVHSSHEQRSRANTIQSPDNVACDGSIQHRRQCIFNWVVLEWKPTHAHRRLHGYGVSCAFRLCAFTGIHRHFVNRLLSFFGTGKSEHAQSSTSGRFILFVHVWVVLVAYVTLMLVMMMTANDDDEYLNWTIREWFLLYAIDENEFRAPGQKTRLPAHCTAWTQNNNNNNNKK